MRVFVTAIAAIAMTGVAAPASSQVVRSGAGATAADIAAPVNQFRTDLGGGTVAGANGSFGGVRREINWDGVPDAFSAPNNLPPNFFNVNSPRGVVFSTPGTGFQVSSTAASGTPVEFGNIDASYTQTFATFSPQRLFTPIGSNILDVTFFIPGTTIPAFTNGFGSVFSDVDFANTTTLTFFGSGGTLLGTFAVPNVAGANETLSFLGVSFSDFIVSTVRITNGNAVLQTGGLDGEGDRVVMDDFIYGEPRAVPEPATWAMLLGGFGAIGLTFRRRRPRLQRA
jgi:PEP-CTERM motif